MKIQAHLQLRLRPLHHGLRAWWSLAGPLEVDERSPGINELLSRWQGQPIRVACAAGARVRWCHTWMEGLRHVAEHEHHPEHDIRRSVRHTIRLAAPEQLELFGPST